MKNITLIVLSPGFAANEADSTCIPALQNFVREAKLLGPDLNIKIFSLHYPFNEGSYVWNGIQCFSFGGKNRGGLFAFYLRRKVKRHLKKICEKENVVGVLSIWMSDCALIGQALKQEFAIPHYCWMHGQDARVGNKHIKTISPLPEQVIAISDMLQKEFEKNYGIKAKHIIENGIIENDFPDLNNETRSIDVIGVGSLIPLKNYELFIEVIAEIKKNLPTINAVIIGEGSEKEILQKKINALGLTSTISLTGSVPHSKVLNYLKRSKILLHTSTYEGSSGVIMEALYSGCFVVSNISVSLKPVKNIELAHTKADMIRKIELLLSNKNLKHERFAYNTMKNSAKKIISLFDL